MESKPQIMECSHDKYKYINKNPQADGIEDIIFIDIICENCMKVLVSREECISASSTTVHDKEWGKSHNFKDELY